MKGKCYDAKKIGSEAVVYIQQDASDMEWNGKDGMEWNERHCSQ